MFLNTLLINTVILIHMLRVN